MLVFFFADGRFKTERTDKARAKAFRPRGPGAIATRQELCLWFFSSLHSLTACLCRIGSQELDLGRFTVYSPAIMLGLMTYVCGPPVEKMSFDINHCPRNRPLHRDMQPNIVMKEMLLPFRELSVCGQLFDRR